MVHYGTSPGLRLDWAVVAEMARHAALKLKENGVKKILKSY
jgi:hypothetical protein